MWRVALNMNTENTQQLNILPQKSCAFTGHRELGKDFCKPAFKKALESLIQEGVTVFYNGLALGFDTVVCETLLELKKKYPQIKIIGCIPCENQDKYFNFFQKAKYQRLLKQIDETVMVSSGPYYSGCMQKRNRYMCDRADVLIAYLKKETGGTAYTVHYFQNKYPAKKIYFI